MRRSLQILFVLALASVAAFAQAQTSGTDQNGNKPRWGTNRNTSQNNTTTNRAHHGWGPHSATTQNTATSNPNTPPGWAHGRKVGWRGNDMPPGQAKRDPYEHRYRRHHRHHRDVRRDHDRDRLHHDRDHDRH